MATKIAVADSRAARPVLAFDRPKWGLPQYLAALAVPILVAQTWVWIAWLRTGPVAITKYRDTSDISWKLAWVYQIFAVLLLIIVGTWVIRGCLRERRLTFDASLCIAGGLTFWTDPFANFSMPVYTYSSNWINLNDWLGQVPFVRYPDAGRLPEPILFLLPLYLVGWCLAAVIVDRSMRWARNRFRSTSMVIPVAVGAGVALTVEFALELPMFVFSLWSYQGTLRVGLFADSGHIYPLTEMFIGMLAFLVLGALRYHRNDRGESIVERNTARLGSRRRQLVTVLALTTLFNGLWGGMAVLWNVFGLYSSPWKDMKPFVFNGVCDTPSVKGTRYGPCPGSPGFKLPLPGSLEGSKPKGDDRYLNGPTQCETCKPFTAGGISAPPSND